MASTLRAPLQEQNTNLQHQEHCAQTKKEVIKHIHTSTVSKTEETQNKDSSYFRNVIKVEQEKLMSECDLWQNHLENLTHIDDGESVAGDIRTAIGQAKLVISERFTQFEGLVNNCEFGTSEKPVTCEDLQGFWDMIYFQVEDVNRKFTELENRRENHWKVISDDAPVQTKRKVPKKTISKPSAAKTSAEEKRQQARKRLAAAKAALKNEKRKSVTFDAVFFKVDSPLRAPTVRIKTSTSVERKRPITPSCDNFMHGRLIRGGPGAVTPTSKKVLKFDEIPRDMAEDHLPSVDKKTCVTEEVTPVLSDGNSADVKLSQRSSDTRSVATATEPYDPAITAKALSTITQQLEILRNLHKPSLAKLEPAASPKAANAFQKPQISVQPEPFSEEKEEISAEVDSYASHYCRLLEKVSLLEAELFAYRKLKDTLGGSKLKWKQTFKLFDEKMKQLKSFELRLKEESERIKEKENLENEELIRLRQINMDQARKIEDLKNKVTDFDNLSVKYKEITEEFQEVSEKCENLQEGYHEMKEEKLIFQMRHINACKTIDGLRSNIASLEDRNSFELEEFTTEKCFLEEERNLLRDHLAKTEDALNSAKSALDKMTKRVANQQKANEEMKEKLEKTCNEMKSLQEERDITKTNSRLAILQQQEDVINCEAKLDELLNVMTSFLSNLKTIEPDKSDNEYVELSDHPMKTPSKSLVVSALLRNNAGQGESPNWSPEIRSDGKSEARLFALVNDVTTVMGQINKTAMAVSAQYQMDLKQLKCDKASLQAKVDALMDEISAKGRAKNQTEFSLRRRLDDVTSQRDELHKKLASSNKELFDLSKRFEERVYPSHV